MNHFPPEDPVIEAYLKGRVRPANMDCEGTPDSLKVVGKRIPKNDAFEKVTGQARYTADIKLPRMLHGRILRAPHAHAELLEVDTAAARAIPGVKAVITGQDFDQRYGIIPWTRDEQPLCREKVRFIGDGVAAVAALTPDIAEEALAAIKVRYRPLKPTFHMGGNGDPIHNDSDNISKDVEFEFGDADEGFAQAQTIVEDHFYYEASTHAPMENHAAIGHFGPDGRLTLWSATQTPHYLHHDLAKLLNLSPTQVRVIKPHLGGGFGGKSEPFPLEFCAALLAMRTGRPVRICQTREETFLCHRGRHAMEMDLRLGYHPQRGLSLDYKAKLDGGAYSSYGMITTYYSGTLNAGIYKVADYRWQSRRYFTNKPPAGPKRGHGTVQPRFALECLMDRLAEQLEEDPIALRKRLFAGENVMTVNGLQVGSSGFLECLDAVAERSLWHQKFRKLPFGKGIGVAGSMYISGTNFAILPNSMPQSGIQLKVDRSGLVTIFTGTADIGQGSDGILRQLVAEELGLKPGACVVVSGDSDLCPVDLGSYSSRATLMAGNAAISAARGLKRQIMGVIGKHWSRKPAELACGDNWIFPADDPETRISFQNAVEMAETQLGTLGATGSYNTPNRGAAYRGALVGPSPAYSFTAHVAEVTVDPQTGRFQVTRVYAAHDCGRAINPTHVEGQIEGSVYMGLGEATLEAFQTKEGRVTTPNLLEYKLPTSADVPPIESIIIEKPDPEGPYGAKEAGEGPLHPIIPAIANAIYDAVGIRLTRTPFSPHDLYKKLQSLRHGGPQ